MGSQRVRHYWVANTFSLLWDPVKAMDSPSKKGSTQSIFTFNMMCTMSESLEPSWVHVKTPYLPQKELLFVFKNEQKIQHRSFMKWTAAFRFCLSQNPYSTFCLLFYLRKIESHRALRVNDWKRKNSFNLIFKNIMICNNKHYFYKHTHLRRDICFPANRLQRIGGLGANSLPQNGKLWA